MPTKDIKSKVNEKAAPEQSSQMEAEQSISDDSSATKSVAESISSDSEEEVPLRATKRPLTQQKDSQASKKSSKMLDLPPAALEVFCGSARLALELQRAGFVAIGVDHRYGRFPLEEVGIFDPGAGNFLFVVFTKSRMHLVLVYFDKKMGLGLWNPAPETS